VDAGPAAAPAEPVRATTEPAVEDAEPDRPSDAPSGEGAEPAGAAARPARRPWLLLACYAVAVAVDIVVTVLRLDTIRHARYAGHADPSFYYQFARNLAGGRGPTIDFVWHFLTPPPAVHHYAPDYWQPLPSVLMAVPMWLAGSGGLPAALVATVLAGALVPVAAALLARALSDQPLVPPAVLALTAVTPQLAKWSVQAESVPFYAVFVLLALAMAGGHWSRRARWVLAGIFAAAAYLCRNDGLLLVLLLGAALIGRAGRAGLAWRRDRDALQANVADLACFTAGVLGMLLPWLATNLREMGHAVPATTRLPFLASYEDMFAVDGGGGDGGLLPEGLGHALTIRSHSLARQWAVTLTAVGAFRIGCLLVAVAGWLLLVRRRRPAAPGRFGWPLVGASVVAVFAFHTLVTPVASSTGAWERSLVAYVPVLVIAIVAPVFAATGSVLLRGAMVAVVATQGVLASQGLPAHAVHGSNVTGAAMARLRPLLLAAAPAGQPVVMTRQPWELTEATGFASVQIPNDDLCTILATAHRYGVTVLLLPAPRAALRDPAVLSAAGFEPAGRTGRFRAYRLPRGDGGCQAGG
jgi:hypothetical protein